MDSSSKTGHAPKVVQIVKKTIESAISITVNVMPSHKQFFAFLDHHLVV